MLRDVEAIVVTLNIMAVALGYMWRRHRQSRRSASLEHIKQLEQEHKEMDEAMKRIQGEGKS